MLVFLKYCRKAIVPLEKKQQREYGMSECIIYRLILKSVLSYPSSLWGQAMSMPGLLQETRIRKYGLWKNQGIYVGAIRKPVQHAVLSIASDGSIE
jgi:hypothetical protein